LSSTADTQQFTSLIVTGTGAAAVLVAGVFYQKLQDWFTAKVLKKPTKAQESASNAARAIGTLIDLHYEEHDLKDSYKKNVRLQVNMVVESVINEQREAAREVECCTEVDLRSAIHDYKCAGESLKVELVKLYMDKVDANGFLTKSPVEWQSYVTSLFEAMVGRSNNHYDNWYTRQDLGLDLIREQLKQRKPKFYEMNNTLMNNIREKAAELEARTRRHAGSSSQPLRGPPLSPVAPKARF
jgi:hypothetical protein